MAQHAEAIGMPRSGILEFINEELTLGPGRLAAMFRIAGNCAVIVAIAMLYRIPLPAYMAYAVFLVSHEETASTVLTAVAAMLAFAIAVGLSLIFYTLDASEPAMRLPLMAASTFVAMFCVRTTTLGPIAFLAGFVLVLSQTLIDRFPSLEAMTHLVLWLWVLVAVPAVITTLVNLLLGESPTIVARREALRLLDGLAASLRRGDEGSAQREPPDVAKLLELRHKAGMFDRGLRGRGAVDTILIETLAEMLTLYRLLPADTSVEVLLPIAIVCEACAASLRSDGPPDCSYEPGDLVLQDLSPASLPIVVAMSQAASRLLDGFGKRQSPVEAPTSDAKKSPFSPDAFTNPDHVRFALKTTIAVMASYIIYSGLDWSGISTSITTCFFVALGSLGETIHKLTLRLSGAVIGGLVGGVCIVYVLPHMTDIGQLCLLIAGVSFVSAWIATASDLIAYAGMQMAFAFFLGVLQDYGPATDLTVLRDRVVGILLGNILMSLVFSVLWPVSAADRTRASLAKALRTLGQLVKDGRSAKPGSRLAVLQAVGEARRFMSLAPFELRLLPTDIAPHADFALTPQTLDRLAGATFAASDQIDNPAIEGLVRQQDEAIAGRLAAMADRLTSGAPDRALVRSSDIRPIGDRSLPVSVRAAIKARELLQWEIDNAFS